MKKFLLLIAFFIPFVSIGQVNQYTANRLFAKDSIRLVDIWLRKISTNLNSDDSNSHNMIATNRAIMDALRNAVSAGTATANNGLSKVGNNIQLGQAVDAPGNPAALLDNLEIPLNNRNIFFRQSNVRQIQFHNTPDITILGPASTNPPHLDLIDSESGAVFSLSRFTTGGALHVGGTVSADLFLSSETGNIFIDGPGFVTDLGQKFQVYGTGYFDETLTAMSLDVQGNARITGSTGTSDALMGRSADGDISGVTIGGGLQLVGNELSTTGGSSITSVNGQTGPAITLATGNTGTDFAIAAAANTITVNLPTGSATNRGAISSADWTTFNNKLSSITGLIQEGANITITGTGIPANPFVINASGGGGGGLTSVNGQTGPAITLATGTAGSDFNVTQAANSVTYNLPDAGLVQRGAMNIGSQFFSGRKTFTGAITVESDATKVRLQVGGNMSFSDEPGINGTGLVLEPFLYTDGGAARTVLNNQAFHYVGIPTIEAANPVTYTDAATFKIIASPQASTNMTITRPRSLHAQDIAHSDMMAHMISESSAAAENMIDIGIYIATGTTATYTLPDRVVYRGGKYYVKNAGSGNLTIQRSGSDNIYETSSVTSIIIPPGESRILIAGLNFWYVL